MLPFLKAFAAGVSRLGSIAHGRLSISFLYFSWIKTTSNRQVPLTEHKPSEPEGGIGHDPIGLARERSCWRNIDEASVKSYMKPQQARGLRHRRIQENKMHIEAKSRGDCSVPGVSQ